MIEYTNEYLIKLKALSMAGSMKVKCAMSRSYEKAAHYRSAEINILNDLGLEKDYILNHLTQDILTLETHLNRKAKINNLLDESGR